MAFNSLQFVGFFLIVWLLVGGLAHHAVLRRLFGPAWPRRRSIVVRNSILLVASYTFYGAWDVRFLSLIVLSTAVDYYCGAAMGRSDDDKHRRRLLNVSLITNLGLLGTFKYFDFFSHSLQDLLTLFGVSTDPVLLDILLPVGISFYTFQTLSYTIDIYRRDLRPTKSLLDFATFVAFFPQLVAGPIERARDLVPQFAKPRPITWARVESGMHLIGAGLFKKVVIADNVSLVADAVFKTAHPTGLQSLMGVYAFAIQIYCDFSGYTDIARGTASCLGFDLSKNFNLPYFAKTPSDFWRRWHISLSSWLRDYLYISLGGNRGAPWRTYRNLMLTMLLGGLWHGAAWTFVAWGAFHGVVLVIYRLIERPIAARLPQSGHIKTLLLVLATLFYFQITAISWLLFRAKSLHQAGEMFASLVTRPLGDAALSIPGPFGTAVALTALLFSVQLYAFVRKEDVVFLHWPPAWRGALIYAPALLLFALVGNDGASPFIYFQF